MNSVSSRSHSVLTLRITGRHDGVGSCLSGSLNLVDLAGRCAGLLLADELEPSTHPASAAVLQICLPVSARTTHPWVLACGAKGLANVGGASAKIEALSQPHLIAWRLRSPDTHTPISGDLG